MNYWGNFMRSKTDRVICGTCEYWTGNRTPTLDKNGNEKVDILDLHGNCENVNCKFTDKVRDKEAKCKNHSKWTELM